MSFFYLLLLGWAVSIDGFIAGIAYGLKDIFIPLYSLFIIGLTTIVATGIGMSTAYILGTFINTQIAMLCGACLLMIIGLFSLFQEYLINGARHNIAPNIGHLVITIMANPEKADVDQSRGINSIEALFLGLALGADNMIATFAAALIDPLPLYTPFIMGCIQIIVITAGIYTSKYFIPETLKKPFPYIPGMILILLGLVRLMQYIP